MKEELFRELCANGCERLDIAGKNVPALVSTCTDEQTVMVGGIVSRANYTARICSLDISLSAAELPGKVIQFDGRDFRVLQSKKHPRSEVIHLIIGEK